MKKKTIDGQVQPVVSQFWYEIIGIDNDIHSCRAERFDTREEAQKQLVRDYFIQPHKFKIVRIKIG